MIVADDAFLMKEDLLSHSTSVRLRRFIKKRKASTCKNFFAWLTATTFLVSFSGSYQGTERRQAKSPQQFYRPIHELLLTLGAHAQRVTVVGSVCLSVHSTSHFWSVCSSWNCYHVLNGQRRSKKLWGFSWNCFVAEIQHSLHCPLYGHMYRWQFFTHMHVYLWACTHRLIRAYWLTRAEGLHFSAFHYIEFQAAVLSCFV